MQDNLPVRDSVEAFPKRPELSSTPATVMARNDVAPQQQVSIRLESSKAIIELTQIPFCMHGLHVQVLSSPFQAFNAPADQQNHGVAAGVRAPVILEPGTMGLLHEKPVGKPVVVPVRAPSLVQQLQRQGSKAFDFAVKAKELGTEFGKHAVFDAIGVAPYAKASKWIGDYLSLFGYAFWVIFLAIFTYFWVTNFRNM